MSDYTPTTNEVRNAWWRDQCPEGDLDFDDVYNAAFDRWLAVHDAEKRAEWEAEQGEVEWETGWFCEWDDGSGVSRLLMGAETWGPRGRVFQMRRRKPSPNPWVPVNENGETRHD